MESNPDAPTDRGNSDLIPPPPIQDAPGPPDPKPPTLWEIRSAARREKLRDLLPRRLPVSAMARALDISPSQCYADIEVLRREMAGQIATTSVMDIAADIQRTADLIEKDAWNSIAPKKDGYGKKLPEATIMEKVAVWNLIRQNRRDTVKMLQNLGVTFKAPIVIQVQTVALEKINALPAAVQAEIANSDDTQLPLLLAKHLGAELAAQVLGTAVGTGGALAAVAETMGPPIEPIEPPTEVQPTGVENGGAVAEDGGG